MTALHDQAYHEARRARVAAATRCVKGRGAVPPTALPGCVRFTFDMETGAFRRRRADVLGQSMHDSGMDVSWTDTRSGLFGIVRRFTVLLVTFAALLAAPPAFADETIAFVPGAAGFHPNSV